MNVALSALLSGLDHERLSGAVADPLVLGVTADSRRVTRGSVFVAVRGQRTDGHAHLPSAIERGATVLVVERVPDFEVPTSCTVVRVDDARIALGVFLGAFRGRPDRALRVVAVTGTNGKTTVSHLVRDLLREGGEFCGLIGTIRYETPRRAIDAPLTTPSAEDLVELLAEMRDGGARAVSMEASSHALDQRRLAGIEVDVAAFTNLTHEHLDYHGTLEAYLAAKRRLLDHLVGGARVKAPGRAVVNLDDARWAACSWPADTVFVGRDPRCAVRIVEASCTRAGTRMQVVIDGRPVQLESRLLGTYNVENLALTAGIAVASGIEAHEIARRFPALRPVPGRLEPVEIPDGPLVLVDYAHTPDGIGSALRAVRQIESGPLTIVFGCGGDRDRTKRAPMAAAALAGADRVILTLDNPRTEDPEQIFADTIAGFATDPQRAERVTDRAEAIAHALAITPRNGVVLVAGKGHETYQIIGTTKLPWDDRAAVRAAWSARGGI